jgi:uncharacterized glyoxalase superfamily protein PhnB
MADKVKPVPDGFHTLTPHLAVRGAKKAIDFYQRAFGAEVLGIHYAPGGQQITHATLKIGDSLLMVSDSFSEQETPPPAPGCGDRTVVHVYVDKVDALFNRAVAAGATVLMPVTDAFWGDRYGQLRDPVGNTWSLATHIQDLTSEQIQKAGEAFFAKMGQGKAPAK